MRRIRKFLLVFAVFLLVLPSLPVSAESNQDNNSGGDTTQGTGEVSSKDEVVYGKLSATGKRQEIYVVNIFDVEEAGTLIDYGPYTSLKNLTNLNELEQTENTIEFEAPEGKFYYQGNMNEEPLPWDISITYLLDGEEIAPKALAGKEGHVEIRIVTSANDQVDSVFFENYLLQVSLSLSLDRFQHIQAPDGMVANAGKSKQVSFSVMPEKEEELVVEADTTSFELDGIDISAVPSSLPIDDPNISDMKEEMGSLSDAIAEINDGVTEFEKGVRELNDGVSGLAGGSKKFENGMAELAASSPNLVNGSADIQGALDQISASLENGSEEMDLSGLTELENGLVQLADGLRKSAQGLTTFKGEFNTAYDMLNEQMEAIPDVEILPAEVEQLKTSDANQEVVKKLLDTYKAARKAKATYSKVMTGFDAVGPTLDQFSGSLEETAKQVDTMASELSKSLKETDPTDSITQLQDGISELASNYKDFHTGLVDYTGGVSQLSNSYTDLHGGIVDLSEGTGELEDGANELHDGTAELHQETDDLPDKMEKEVNQMMDEYDTSDFEPVSFVSPKNEMVNSVQFVLKTESITYEEEEKSEEQVEEEKGFWEKLFDLFK